MFNSETCKRCGACLMLCPFVEMGREQARKEITRLIETRMSDSVLTHCAGCSYCDVICPTRSNPSELRKEILQGKNRQNGVSGLRIMSEQVPFNIMTAGLETDKKQKFDRLEYLSNPGRHEEVLFLGCSLSYIHTDLARARFFDDLPAIGGMQHCCGAYVYQLFGEEEAKISAEKLLEKFKSIGVKRVLTFCPECDYMLSKVYPKILKGFDIRTVPIIDYLLERHLSGALPFTQTLDKKVTFHDACGWRKLGDAIHESPRRLLSQMGARVFEMKHNRSKSMCCGTPLAGKKSRLAAAVAEKRVAEAKASGAEAIVVNCTGCFSLMAKAARHGLELYHIIELVQLATGEFPPHRIKEVQDRLVKSIVTKIGGDPDILNRKYIIRDGKVAPLI